MICSQTTITNRKERLVRAQEDGIAQPAQELDGSKDGQWDGIDRRPAEFLAGGANDKFWGYHQQDRCKNRARDGSPLVGLNAVILAEHLATVGQCFRDGRHDPVKQVGGYREGDQEISCQKPVSPDFRIIHQPLLGDPDLQEGGACHKQAADHIEKTEPE